jgi:hypothetical protein
MIGVKMTSGSSIRKSKYGLNAMKVGEVKIFDTPTERDKDLIRRAAHNQNERTDRHYMTRTKGDTIHVTRLH